MENDIDKKPTRVINGISIIVVALVAILLAMPVKYDLGPWTKALPHVIGSVNSLTVVILICGLAFIKSGRIGLHRVAMSTAFILGIVFLCCYLTYHLSNPSRPFAGTGAARMFYLAVLASHILLSLIVLPFVLRAMYFALTKQFLRHKKIARFAYPIWFYVAVSGVTVYLFNYQFFD